jgi:hypothetical protein
MARVCTITREHFRANARKTDLTAVTDIVKQLSPRAIVAGNSLGWYAGGKATVCVDGKVCDVQVGMNVTIIGSKDVQ